MKKKKKKKDQIKAAFMLVLGSAFLVIVTFSLSNIKTSLKVNIESAYGDARVCEIEKIKVNPFYKGKPGEFQLESEVDNKTKDLYMLISIGACAMVRRISMNDI